MRARISYFLSGLLHTCLAWALAAGDSLIRPEFQVRSGQARPEASAASRAIILVTRLDNPVTTPIEMPVPEIPPPSTEITSPPPTADLDHRYVPRPPIEELTPRRMERKAAVVLDPRSTAAPIPAAMTTPQLEGRPLDELPTSAPEAEIPPLQAITATRLTAPTPAPAEPVAVVEEATAETNSMAASAPQGAKVDRLPRPLPDNREPVYPEELRRQRIGGRVLLRVTIGPDGRVADAAVSRSSGEPLLDEAALTAVRTWQFVPAQRAGAPVLFAVLLPVSFSIRE